MGTTQPGKVWSARREEHQESLERREIAGKRWSVHALCAAEVKRVQY